MSGVHFCGVWELFTAFAVLEQQEEQTRDAGADLPGFRLSDLPGLLGQEWGAELSLSSGVQLQTRKWGLFFHGR